MTTHSCKRAINRVSLEPQSRFGGKLLEICVVCPQNGTAVLKGLNRPVITALRLFFVLTFLDVRCREKTLPSPSAHRTCCSMHFIGSHRFTHRTAACGFNHRPQLGAPIVYSNQNQDPRLTPPLLSRVSCHTYMGHVLILSAQ